MSLTEILTQRLQGLGRKLVLPLAVLATSLSTGGCAGQKVIPFFGAVPHDRYDNPRNTSAAISQNYFFLAATEFSDNGDGVLSPQDFKGWTNHGVNHGVILVREGTPLIFAGKIDEDKPFAGLTIYQYLDEDGREISSAEENASRGRRVRVPYNDNSLRRFNPKDGAIWEIQDLPRGNYTITLTRGNSPERKDTTQLDPWKLYMGDYLFIKVKVVP